MNEKEGESIAVVGGGVIGLSIAWYLAKAGAKISLFEEDICGRDASWASAGMLAPHAHDYPQLRGMSDTARSMADTVLTIERQSRDLWETYYKELERASGIDVGHRLGGSLAVGFSGEESRQLEADYQLQKGLGLDIEWLSAKDVLEMEPKLSPTVTAASFSPTDGQVEPRSVTRAMRQAFLNSGGELREHTAVSSIKVENSQVRGVETNRGPFRADKAVIAAGAWSGQISGVPEIGRPLVSPVKGQMIALTMNPQHPLLKRIVFAKGNYHIPRTEERLVVGATFEQAGYDTSNTVAGVTQLLGHALEAVPTVKELPIAEMWAGLRPRSADNAPILGPTGVDGLVMATGHFHVGVVMSPLTAQYIGDFVLTGKLPSAIEQFGIDRFRQTS